MQHKYNCIQISNLKSAFALFRLNAIRELCARCPLVMTEDLLRDLAQYKSYRDRSVMMAARSLIHVYRLSMPKLLHKKDRVSILTETIWWLREINICCTLVLNHYRIVQMLRLKKMFWCMWKGILANKVYIYDNLTESQRFGVIHKEFWKSML